MLVQQLLFAGWLGYYLFRERLAGLGRVQDSITRYALVYIAISLTYWFVMGSFLLGESRELSARVKRTLPKSFSGRVLFTWFNPGPGTGYLFAISNALAVIVLTAIAIGVAYYPFGALMLGGSTATARLETLFVLGWAYFVIYLGIANLLLLLIRSLATVTVSTSVLINFLLVLAGWGIPKVLREMMDSRGVDYTFLHVTDPVWSCYVATDPSTSTNYATALIWRVLPMAAAVLLVNLVYIVPEIWQVRARLPIRIEEEDRLLATESTPITPLPTSPWD